MIRRPFRSAPWVSLAFAVMVSPVFGADDKPVTGDLKSMQGEWISTDETGESTWTFKGDKVTLKTPNRSYELIAKLDPEAKPAKSVDFTATEDSPDAKGSTVMGIYQFEGETLRICFNGPEGQRPTEFKNDFPKQLLFELKKKK
ncbi:MAG: TIGR03067 domain-containing protein [Isosphaeraceae bacterium]